MEVSDLKLLNQLPRFTLLSPTASASDVGAVTETVDEEVVAKLTGLFSWPSSSSSSPPSDRSSSLQEEGKGYKRILLCEGSRNLGFLYYKKNPKKCDTYSTT